MDTNELKNVSLSEGTMRPEDLIPCFISALRVIEADNYLIQGSLDQIEKKIQDDYSDTENNYFDTEESSFDLDYLFDTLNAVMWDENFYFGAHPGDGSDYGFWECESDD